MENEEIVSDIYKAILSVKNLKNTYFYKMINGFNRKHMTWHFVRSFFLSNNSLRHTQLLDAVGKPEIDSNDSTTWNRGLMSCVHVTSRTSLSHGAMDRRLSSSNGAH